MRLVKTIFFFSASLVFYSCEKVIDIKVKESDIKYVIEGIITTEPGCKVYITRTKPFNEDNDFSNVSGATVKVKDNNIEHMLTELSPGVYETALINGDIAFRQHKGGHTTAPNWETFLEFADRYFK